MKDTFFLRNIAAFYLLLFCICIVPIEGVGVSMLKVGTLIIAPLILFFCALRVSRALIWSLFYFTTVLFSSVIINYSTFRVSTIIYLGMFLLMFCMYYNLLYFKHVFSIDYALKLFRFVLLAYVIVLVIQQIITIIGLKYSLGFFFNIQTMDDAHPFKLNSLSIEPSHSARIMSVLFLAILRLNEYKKGTRPSIRQLYNDNKYTILGFLYAMITMVSGTAFVALSILMLYFLKKKYVAIILPMFFALYFIIPLVDYEPFTRAKDSFDAALSNDTETMISTDVSAAYRVLPMMNTLNDLDLSSSKTWFGEGIDTGANAYIEGLESYANIKLGLISDYGLFSYIIALCFVFSCCIKHFWSIETLMFFLLLGGAVSNIAYGWGILLILTCTKYFKNYYKLNNYGNDE
jgi:hypothetical protein